MSFGFGFGFPKNYVAALFSPAQLFTGSTNGVWYDPSDLTTLYQDAAGTAPVTAVGQPVGLMLDKSKGLVLGPELVANGTFGANIDGWSSANNAVISWESEKLQISGNGTTAYPYAVQTISGLTIGKSYRFYGVANKVSGANSQALIQIGAALSGTSIVTNGEMTAIWLATTTSVQVRLMLLGATSTYNFDNISVRELPGNHAFNSSGNSANFPVLSARYNLLTKTEQFDDADWSKYNVTVTPNTTIAPDGTNTADTFTTTSSVSALYLSGFTSLGPSKWSIRAKPGTSRYIALIVGNYRGDQGYVVFDIQDGVVGQTGNGTATTLVSGSITPSSQGFFVCTMSYTRTTSGNCKIELAPTLTGNTFDGYGEVIGNPVGSSAIIWGADLRVANDALNQPAYQRVNTATDYDTVGFKPYLAFNGVNQWLQTNSIDFSYGDKMFVCAGVRKLSDATTSAVVELSNTSANPGVFLMYAPGTVNSIARSYVFGSGVSAIAVYQDLPTNSAPSTNIVSGIGSISTPNISLRVNGAQVAQSSASQGTGNYGNYPLYIGARAGSSLWFNGRLYGMVIAGKQASASEIASTEAWLNQKTGAF